MTPQDQNIAMAKLDGWVYRPIAGNWKRNGQIIEADTGLPNYLLDLNTVARVEKLLTDEQSEDYQRELCILLDGPMPCMFASPSQRTEAILRTLNLWKEQI